MDANRGTPQDPDRTIQSRTSQGRGKKSAHIISTQYYHYLYLGMDANCGTPQDPSRTIQSRTPQGRGKKSAHNFYISLLHMQAWMPTVAHLRIQVGPFNHGLLKAEVRSQHT